MKDRGAEAMGRRLPLRLAAVLGLCLFAACAVPGSRPPVGWERVLPDFREPVYQLLRDSDDPRRIYAACGWQNQRTGGVLRSVDGGKSWLAEPRGLPAGADVLALAFAPPGFPPRRLRWLREPIDGGLGAPPSRRSRAGAARTLVAGTRHSGLFLSNDAGASWQPLGREAEEPEWERLTVQALLGVPAADGGPPAVLAGTQGRGVLYSADGGATWQPSNEGLDSLRIEALASAPGGGVVAATWSGVYASAGPGRAWQRQPLTSEDEQMAAAAVAFDDDGTLWVGLQNSGLRARPRGAEAFALQGEDVLRDAGVLAIAAGPGRLALGTSGQGTFFGRFGEPFVQVREGLDNPSVSSLSVDPDDPGWLIAGTPDGLFCSCPPTLPVTLLTAGLALGLGLTAVGAVLWRRTEVSAAARAARKILKVKDFTEGSTFLDGLGMSLPPARRQPFLERFAGCLERRHGAWPHFLAEDARLRARLVGALGPARRRMDAETRGEAAERLAAFAAHQEILTGVMEEQGLTRQVEVLAVFVRENRFLARLLGAESLSRVAALRADLEEGTRRASKLPEVESVFGLLELHRLLAVFGQLHQSLTAEERPLLLGQALTVLLEGQEDMERRCRAAPSLSLALVVVTFESLRYLLTASLRDVRQSAELVVGLRSRVLTGWRETVVALEVKNVGQGNAHKVEAELLPDDELFRVVRPRQGVKHLLRQQSAQLEFLIKPRVSDRVRLRFHLTYSDLGRQDQELEFADVVELRRLAESTFVPLYPNPYVVGRPLGEGDVFVGREKTLERIAASLGGAYQDKVVLLIGQRRMGKTSILRRLRTRLSDAYVPVLVDLQGLLGEGDVAFFRELAAIVQDDLAEAGVEVAAPAEEDLRRDPGGTFRRRFLREVTRRLGERRLLLMIDEFEVLEERILSGALTPQILPYLRGLVRQEKALSVLLAGTHRLDELTADSWSVLFHLAVYLDVGHFSQSQVAELFTAPTKGVFEIDPLALDKAFRLTGGHPHFSQLLAREMVEQRNQQRLPYVTVQDLHDAAEAVVDKGQLHIAYLWNGASHSERMLMLAMCELLDREGLASLTGAHSYLRQQGVEAGDLPAAARRLEKKEVLTSQSGHLSFRMELLRRWLRSSHSLELDALAGSPSAAEPAEER